MTHVRSSFVGCAAVAAGWALSLLGVAAPAAAQIIYEPVRYQYGHKPTFYYGGSDPAVFEYAERLGCLYHHVERGGGRGDRPTTYLSSRVLGPRQYVFSDCAPHMNLWLYGFTPTDARNEAYGNVPRYFRKGDLLRAAVPVGRRGWVVPAQARPVGKEVRRRILIDDKSVGEDARGAEPKAIIIIPKGPRQKPKPDQGETTKTVAANEG